MAQNHEGGVIDPEVPSQEAPPLAFDRLGMMERLKKARPLEGHAVGGSQMLLVRKMSRSCSLRILSALLPPLDDLSDGRHAEAITALEQHDTRHAVRPRWYTIIASTCGSQH